MGLIYELTAEAVGLVLGVTLGVISVPVAKFNEWKERIERDDDVE